MDEHREFQSLHLPQLINYVVPLLQSKGGDVELGSGVLVKAGGRHFIATAKHCIDADVKALRSMEPLRSKQDSVGMRPLRILQKGWHDTLDLGYLEIEDPQCQELSWHQLCTDKIVGGIVQIIGYPTVLVEKNATIPGRLMDLSLAAGTFGTTLTKETDDCMAFNYPKIGSRYDPETGQWSESPFPKTPKGFSGGACFGVLVSEGKVARADYKLLAIEYAWDEVSRVFAIPIKRWKELLVQHGLSQP